MNLLVFSFGTLYLYSFLSAAHIKFNKYYIVKALLTHEGILSTEAHVKNKNWRCVFVVPISITRNLASESHKIRV